METLSSWQAARYSLVVESLGPAQRSSHVLRASRRGPGDDAPARGPDHRQRGPHCELTRLCAAREPKSPIRDEPIRADRVSSDRPSDPVLYILFRSDGFDPGVWAHACGGVRVFKLRVGG